MVARLFGGLANGYQPPLDLLEMQAHGCRRAAEVALGDCFDDPFMVGKAVMIRRRARAFGAKTPPDHGPAHGVQHIEQAKQHIVAAGLRDLPVQQIVDVLVLPPRHGLPRLRQRLPHRRDVGKRGVQRRFARDLGFDDEARAHHVGRVCAARDFGNPDRLLDRPPADEGAPADVTPDAAVLLEHRQRLAQIAARHAKALAQLALRGQPGFTGMVHLGQIGLKLNQGGLAATAGIVHQFNQSAYCFPLLVLKRLPQTVNCQVFSANGHRVKMFLLDQSA
ncbi:hypothetical protein MESS4_380047 [Mesorhizobium sp. STM 4661]|nr:hypothetical protein MESS4_380047 [Mesorhizobium sp. STM 4661]